MKEAADFYLTSAGEATGELLSPRACWRGARLKNPARNDWLLVRVDPPVKSQTYGGGADFTHLVLGSHAAGLGLFPVTAWPTYVYICQSDLAARGVTELPEGELKIISWGIILPTRKDADDEVRRFASNNMNEWLSGMGLPVRGAPRER